MNKIDEKGVTVKKDKDFSDWYTQVIIKSNFADYSTVSGCMILRPSAYNVWEKIKDIVDKKIKELGVKNTYFPLFIPESLLAKESTHLKGFTPEVAWVTEVGNTKLNERLAVRPTSEAIMYDSFSKWIKSWRDLPLKLNQWNSVVRWEFKHPTPFLRTREFLWNEGHTAFATKAEAEKEIKDILNLWKEVTQDYMALYGVESKKTEKEKFAGAEYTIALEFLLPNGKSIQGPDVHHDDQIFAKAYNIKFLDKDEKTKYVYQNTWAITTRMIGVMVAIHSDDKGLVIPPKLCENKVVIVPILFEKDKKIIFKKSNELKKQLEEFNPILDDREEYTPGWKFNEWELKGIPIRIEIGPKDIKNKQIIIVRRDTGKKEIIKISKNINKNIEKILNDIQKNLFDKSKKFFNDNKVMVKTFDELLNVIKNKKLVETFWCGNTECEDWIKDKTNGAKIIGIPLKQPKKVEKCVYCKKQGKHIAYIAKSY